MLYLIFFVLGTIVGSFLNVCICRLPQGKSIIFPASHCPCCSHRLTALELVPIFSYFLLKGKCRYCKVPVSFRYPLVEFLTGALFVGTALLFPVPYSLFPFLFVCLMIVVFFIDLEHQVIPDALNFSGIFLGLLYNFFRGLSYSKGEGLNPFLSALYGMLIGYVLLYVIGAAGRFLFKKEAMGEGDFFLGALLGACLGWQGGLLSIFLAYLLAGAISAVLLILGRVKMGEHIPFGPALAAGGVLTLFFGPQIVGWYLGFPTIAGLFL